jgi:hypothetical protein
MVKIKASMEANGLKPASKNKRETAILATKKFIIHQKLKPERLPYPCLCCFATCRVSDVILSNHQT